MAESGVVWIVHAVANLNWLLKGRSYPFCICTWYKIGFCSSTSIRKSLFVYTRHGCWSGLFLYEASFK